jgi:acetoin utilization deacetylase AcuC-like enzyme
MSEASAKPRLFCTDRHAIPVPEGHKFPMRKYGILRRLLEQEGLFHFEPAPLAELQTIELTHDAECVRSFLQGSLGI